MNAQELVEQHGAELIGKQVATQPYGEWPGGVATVFALSLDENAPEIVCNVRNEKGEEIGIFDHEELSLLP